jgi:GNAT superfamily N-acetyltransferase
VQTGAHPVFSPAPGHVPVFTGRADAGVELFLLPEERGIEAGRALLAYAIGVATDHRATVADTNAAMLAVNARLGFTPSGVRRSGRCR